MPIYFGYPKQEKYQITINIPGRIYLPIKVATVENVGLFFYSARGKENTDFFIEEINETLVSSDFMRF
jgi:hypothetical protein